MVVEETALILEHTAEPPTEVVEGIAETTNPDVEKLAALIETQAAAVISETEPLAGAGEDAKAVEEVVPSSDAVRQTAAAEEPIITSADIEVAPIPVLVYENFEEKQSNGIDQIILTCFLIVIR